ncbi:hypothetical protein [Asticcacaulis sp. AC466]|uniref:hypothetical protein n=1 Tax=Asticcacaulis sp. AC466 TaxID=1282362 RepID=UPI00040F6F2B|nr:hypothetical protein [Asticcacaulis sp. AC466]
MMLLQTASCVQRATAAQHQINWGIQQPMAAASPQILLIRPSQIGTAEDKV